MPAVGTAALVGGVSWPTRVLLILVATAAAMAYPVAEPGGRYLHYLLGKQAVIRCDPSRVPDVVAAVTATIRHPGASVERN
jgi:hypothetical protein